VSVGAEVTSNVADYSKDSIRPPETHDRRQWTAVYVGSLAARNGWRRPETVAVGISDELDVVSLKSMHSTDRSQWRSRSISVTRSCRQDRWISLVAALSTDWSRRSLDVGSHTLPSVTGMRSDSQLNVHRGYNGK